MGVGPLGVEVADAVVGLDDAAQLAVAGVVEAGVRREHQQLPRLLEMWNRELCQWFYERSQEIAIQEYMY